MGKIILLCGMACSGKSTYAESIRAREQAVVLSCDELMLRLFDEYMGDAFAPAHEKVCAYLEELTLRIVAAGANVILDFGFWKRADRGAVRARLRAKGVGTELHYLPVSPNRWERNVRSRNEDYAAGKPGVYFMDENMIALFPARFEPPSPEEVDVWVEEPKDD